MRLSRRSLDASNRSISRRLRRLALAGTAILVALSAAGSCRGKGGALTPPRGADAWDAEYARHFDDGLTEIPIRLQGRAPNDVRDQKRFGQRLGLSDIVILTEVSQTWSRGLQGRNRAHFVEVELGRALLGNVPTRTASEQTLEIQTRDLELPDGLQGKTMILFVRWAPGEQPPFHHHLLLATDELVSTIDAMVKHAKREGQLGSAAERRRARREKQRNSNESDAVNGPSESEAEPDNAEHDESPSKERASEPDENAST